MIAERKETGESLNENVIDKIVKIRLADEIKRGIQTIQYQLITLMTCNGQAPFVTMFMYLDEVPEGRTRDDLALIIEEALKQRIQGVKNEKGVWITPAFPKIIYVLDEDNIGKDSEYFYLTELAAKCTAKRMVPDYISAKVMRRLKNGDVYPSMGCRSFLTIDNTEAAEGLCNAGNKSNAGNYEEGQHKYYGRFNQGRQIQSCPLSTRVGGVNALKCWNEPKDLMPKTELETINVTGAKAEKISSMRHAEIKPI